MVPEKKTSLRVLAGGVTNAPEHILRAHLKTLEWQDADAEVDLFYLLDPAMLKNCDEIFSEFDVTFERARSKPEGAVYARTERTHEWSKPTFYWLAQEKQRLLQKAWEEDYDYVFLVDSDLLLGPETLRSLLNARKDVVSSVFYTSWTKGQPPLPQVWLSHPYDFQGLGLEAHEFLERLETRQLTRVLGLGACTLIDVNVLDRVGFWPLVDGLPEWGMWQGEDRHFCVHAQRGGVELWADPWPDVVHLYREEDEAKALEDLERLKDGPKHGRPCDEDLVSVLLEPCEEPELHGWSLPLRGRLGRLSVLPGLVKAIKTLEPGEDRFVRLRFPLWWPIEPYRGREKVVRVSLLDVKRFRLAPKLEDFHEPTYLLDSFYAAS